MLPELIKRKRNHKNHIFRSQLIDSASSLSSLVNNLAEGIHKIKFKYGCNHKRCETWRMRYKDYEWFLEYINFKDNLIGYKCLC